MSSTSDRRGRNGSCSMGIPGQEPNQTSEEMDELQRPRTSNLDEGGSRDDLWLATISSTGGRARSGPHQAPGLSHEFSATTVLRHDYPSQPSSSPLHPPLNQPHPLGTTSRNPLPLSDFLRCRPPTIWSELSTTNGPGEVMDDGLGFVLVETPVGLLYMHDFWRHKRYL